MASQFSAGSGPARNPPTRQPLLWAALAYAAGLIASNYLWRPALWWVTAAVVFISSGLHFATRRIRVAFVLGLAAIWVLGALTIQIQTAPGNSQADLIGSVEGRDVVITAHIVREGYLREARTDIEQKLDVKTEQVATENETIPLRAGLRVSFYAKEFRNESDESLNPSATRLFRYGERVRFPGKIYVPHNFRNPGAFDYEGYLAERGIVGLASAKMENVELLPGFAGSRFELWRTRLHRSIIQKIRLLWPQEQAALVDALLIGENAFVGRELLTDFQRTGTYHVLVISGLKVGILSLISFWFLRRMRINEPLAGAITVLLTVLYAVLTDVGAPVWRATLMLAVYFVIRFVYRQKSVLNAIGAAGLALLLVDPSALFGASYQLSFLCVLIIAAIAAPILERTTQPVARALRNPGSVPYDFALSPNLVQFRLDLRMVGERLQRFLGSRLARLLLVGTGRVIVIACEFFAISVVLQVGFILPMAYYFHRATAVSLPANVLVVPLTEIVMVAAMLTVGISYISLAAAKLPALLAGFALQAMAGSVRRLGALRISDMRLPTPSLSLILLTSAALVLAMVLSRKRARLAAAGMAVLTASSMWMCVAPAHPRIRGGVLEMTTIDVGQGDSILLVSPQGWTLLIDAGGIPRWMHSELDIGEDVVSPYLWSRGIERLDAVAVTHPHADHIGGMGAILANFHPRELWLGSNEAAANSELGRLIKDAKALAIPVTQHREGDKFSAGGVNFRVLAPQVDAESNSRHANEDSLVLDVSYGKTSALLEGDAEKAAERRIAEEDPAADLLKVAHHGSATSTIPELLTAVHPHFAVISVGARNTYGHPRMEVLDRLQNSGVRTFRTDLNGAVTFYLDGRTVTPRVASLR